MSIDERTVFQKTYIDKLTENLAVLRAKAGVSQADLAEAIGIARQTYSAIECKRTNMSLTIFLCLFLYFKENDKTKGLLKFLEIDDEGFKSLLGLNGQLKEKQNSEKKIAAFGGNVLDHSSDKAKMEIKKAIDRIKANGE